MYVRWLSNADDDGDNEIENRAAFQCVLLSFSLFMCCFLIFIASSSSFFYLQISDFSSFFFYSKPLTVISCVFRFNSIYIPSQIQLLHIYLDFSGIRSFLFSYLAIYLSISHFPSLSRHLFHHSTLSKGIFITHSLTISANQQLNCKVRPNR